MTENAQSGDGRGAQESVAADMLNNIPLELRELDQWVNYRVIPRKNGKEQKPPYDPKTGKLADTSDPSTWGSFEQACANLGSFDGIGFVFSENDEFCGVDLDECVTDGEIKFSAQSTVINLDSYSEFSRSGAGVHIIVRGSKPGDDCRRDDIEIYDCGQYLTFTGNHVSGTPRRIESRQDELNAVYHQTFGEPAKPTDEAKPVLPPGQSWLSDGEIIERAMSAANGDKFRKLWEGDISDYDSESEADLALCDHLAFWTNRDVDQIHSLFEQSGLIRDKWYESRGKTTYGYYTIGKSIRRVTKTYEGNRPPDNEGKPGAETELKLCRAKEFASKERRPPEFVVEGIVPRKGITLITGDGGVGKSFMAMELAIAVAIGGRFLQHFECIQGPVLLLDLENPDALVAERYRKIVKGRVESAAMPDDPPVYVLPKDENTQATLYIDQATTKARISRAIERYQPVLVIVDCLVAFHSVKEDDNVNMRRLVSNPLAGMARKYDLAFVVIHHHRKRGRENNDPGQLIRGASDLRNAADSHIALRSSKGVICATHDKSRVCRAVPDFDVEIADSEDESAIYVRWRESAERPKKTGKAELARQHILRLLLDGVPRHSADIIADSRANDHKERTAQRAIARLVEAGEVLSLGNGMYALPPKDAQTVE